MKTINTLLQGSALLGTLALSGCAPGMMMHGGMMKDVQGRLSVAQPAPMVGANGLTLQSAAFRDGGTVPLENVGSGNGCTGQSISPALSWSGAPAGTVSYVVTTYDPDAPTGSGFWHWAAYNIPTSVTSLAKGAGSSGTLPAGAMQLNNSGGSAGYTGPCPPPGAPHRYIFTVYALSKMLQVPANASPELLGFNLNGATLAKTSISATYGR